MTMQDGTVPFKKRSLFETFPDILESTRKENAEEISIDYFQLFE